MTRLYLDDWDRGVKLGIKLHVTIEIETRKSMTAGESIVVNRPDASDITSETIDNNKYLTSKLKLMRGGLLTSVPTWRETHRAETNPLFRDLKFLPREHMKL